MKQRGFTLIELMGIIIILSLISLLVIPAVDLTIKQFKDEAYSDQIKNIKLAANDWAIDNIPKYALNDGDAVTITLAQLKMSNLIDQNIINPKTDEPFADDMIINIIRENNNFTFDVDATSGVQIGLADNAPIITLKGNYVEKRYENNGYVDQGASAKTSAGVAIPATSITKIITRNSLVVPAITDLTGSYTISYSVTDNGITRIIYRVIIFDELKPATPTICFTFNSTYGRITDYSPAVNGCGYDVRIPRTIGGVAVKEIGMAAFKNKLLKSATIPSTITSIGTSAFENNKLTSVTIPSSVITIGDSAFRNNLLSSIAISSGVTSIAWSAFAYNQLTNVVIPSSVTSIGTSAFESNLLSSVELSSNITRIESYTFASNQLTNVVIPPNVEVMGDCVFYENQLTDVTIPDSMIIIGSLAFGDNQLTNVVIPPNVTTIGNQAFFGNQLTDVIIPDSVTSLGDGAFTGNLLTSVTISSGLTSIGWETFSFNQLENVTIPSTVTTIGDYAFNYNQLTTVSIPDSVTSVGNCAFLFNELTSVDIGTGVTTIGDSAFSSNNILQGSAIIRRESGTVTIGTEAFKNNGYDGYTTITPTYIP